MKRKSILLFMLFLMLVLSSCSSSTSPEIYVEPYETQIPPPSSAAQVMAYIKSNNQNERIAGMWATLDYPNSQEEALPLIMDNLYDSNFEIRINSIRVLGELGSDANSAISDLLSILESDTSIEILIEVTIALGTLDNKSAVPFLAENLYATNEGLAVYSAKSISKLTGVSFPDANSSGYHKDDNGTPYILLASKDWWEKDGQYQDWTN